MVLIVICGLLVVAGLAAIVRWGGLEFASPWSAGEEPETPPDVVPPGLVARRFLWYLTVAVGAGIASGLLIAGAGGRLAMRLLAATAGDGAQGRITEAEEVVGRISTGGTVGLIVFVALFFGTASGVVYLLVRRWLPSGRLGGLAFGGLLLIVGATRADPLRSANPDFDLVGPGWLAIVVFGAIVIAHGMLVAAIAARYGRALPPFAGNRRAIAAYAPLLLLAPVAPVLVPVGIVAGLTVLVTRARPVVASLRSKAATTAGRVVVAGVGLAMAPGFVGAVSDIVSR